VALRQGTERLHVPRLRENTASEVSLQPRGLEQAPLTDVLEQLLHVSNEGICLLGPDGVCEEISTTGAQLLGYLPRELSGRGFHAVVHRSSQIRAERCRLCGAISDDFTGAQRLTRKDGTTLEAACTARSVTLERGAVGRLVIFSEASSEAGAAVEATTMAAAETTTGGTEAEAKLRRTVAELAAEKQRMETVYAFARQLFVTPLEDLDRTIVDQFCTLTDSRLGLLYKADDSETELTLAASHGVFRSGISGSIPREQGSVGAALSTRRPVAEDRSSQPLEIAGRAIRHILYVPLWEGEEDLGVLILARTLSRPYAPHEQDAVVSLAALAGVALANTKVVGRLERLSQLTRAALEGSVGGIRLVDPEGRELFSNASMQQLDRELGVRLHGSLYGPEGLEFSQRTTDPEAYVRELQEMQGDRERRSRTEWELRDSGRSFERYSAPIRDSFGMFIGRLLVLRETTAERRAERLRSDVVSFVSHELRTPLTSMLAFTNILLDEVSEGDDWTTHVETIRTELVRLLGIVEDLLDVERMGAAGMAVHRTRFDLKKLIREQVAAQKRTTKIHDFAVNSPSRPVFVEADRERISHVLSNLLSNAIKYSPEGGPIRVRTASTGDAVRVSVTDSGIGIPEDQQERVFTKFYRAESAELAGIRGLGLGLALSREIVAIHGGRIGFDSTPGAGSTFWFELPAEAPAVAAVEVT
jgi:signal transduction histidine kinase